MAQLREAVDSLKEDVFRLRKRGGDSSSGLYTPSPPKSGLHTPPLKSSQPFVPSVRSPGYYFDKLKYHFSANEANKHKYSIVLTGVGCKILGRNTVLHQEEANTTSVRNLYLMLFACNYDVDEFLKRRDEGEFLVFNGAICTTPPDHRYSTQFIGNK